MARSGDRIGDYHKAFADKLIEQIKEERAPFQKPWKPGERSLPENLTTGRAYRGGNSLYLSVEAVHRGYTDNRWATFRQIQEAGGHVKKGEKGAKVLFFSTRTEQAKDDQGNPKLDDAGQPVQERGRPYVRMYTVFNAEQTGGLPPRPPASPEPEWKAHDQAEAIIQASGVDVRHQAGNRAYYNVRTDQVVLPEPGQFSSAGTYYRTALHELGHATGHPDRMNRDTLGKKFGSPEYAREELRAEISAMMTGEKIGLGHEPQNGADYVAGWVKALEDDPREIYRAASDAEKISRYLIEPARERIDQRDVQLQQQMAAHAALRERGQELERKEPDTVTLSRSDAELLVDRYAADNPPRHDAVERLTTTPLPTVPAGSDGAVRVSPHDPAVHVNHEALDNAIYGEKFEEHEQVAPTPALQAAAARQQAGSNFNRNIQIRAEIALEHLAQHRGHHAPPQQLVRDLQGVHLHASQNGYTLQTADFRSLRAGLQNHANDSLREFPEERRTVLNLADNFENQGQGRPLDRELPTPDRTPIDEPKSGHGQRFALDDGSLNPQDRSSAHVVADLPEALREHEALVKAGRYEDASRLEEQVIDPEIGWGQLNNDQDAKDRYLAVSELRAERHRGGLAPRLTELPRATNADINRVVAERTAERTFERDHGPTR
ncbi:MAG: zincin-like metallopeptidase domain-containing protein [Acidobacteria bacterium]|nr:zincin-like metallopeptidase domain-containing protein [Acidobacteriota bacterium]